MTINIDPIQDAVSQHLKAIEQAGDLETLRDNALQFGYFVAEQLKLVHGQMNAQERQIGELQSFAMQVKNKLT
ncbi:hypothetical protein [Bordetella petrii]|uniref:hypothetical protein n=1 Tax=Bordetella petrii TaxID=94624 RepID=UPI00048DCF67|nr:hypothetical protein [Bordetella petrii]